MKESDRTMFDIAMDLAISVKSVGEWLRNAEDSNESMREDEERVILGQEVAAGG